MFLSNPIVNLFPLTLNFGAQVVGTTSPVQSVTLSNIGNAPMSISGIGAIGDFAQTNTCDAAVHIAASCTIDVTFIPTASCLRSGALSIADNVDPANAQFGRNGSHADDWSEP